MIVEGKPAKLGPILMVVPTDSVIVEDKPAKLADNESDGNVLQSWLLKKENLSSGSWDLNWGLLTSAETLLPIEPLGLWHWSEVYMAWDIYP